MERTALCIFLIFSIESFITSGCPLSNFFNGRHYITGGMNKNHNNKSKLKSGNMVEFDRQIRNKINSDFTVGLATEDIGYDPKIERQKNNYEKDIRDRDASFTPMIPEGANFAIPKTFVPEIPEDCLEAGLCDTVPNYPEEYFTWIIETYFLDLVIENNKKPNKKNILQNEPQYLCNVTSKDMKLKAIASNDGNWYFVLNSDKLPLQTFESQMCKTKMIGCANDVVARPYISQCIQLTLPQRVIVFDTTGILKTKQEQIPSGCYCALHLESNNINL